MSPARKPAAKITFGFDTWKTMLCKDCELHGRLPAFSAMSDTVLRLIWETGSEPNIPAIIEAVAGNKSTGNSGRPQM